MRAIQVHELGGPEVLTPSTVDDPSPDSGTVVVRVAFAGINYIDTYLRSGLYPTDLPFVPGFEGSGTIEIVGSDVEGWEPGDRVAWTGTLGSYAERVVVAADELVAVDDGVADDLAAAVMLQGLTAHYLVHDTFALSSGDRCLIHAGAGGVGGLAIQLAKRADATVFTTVSTAEKAEVAREAGADHVIVTSTVDFADAVRDVAGERPLDVVYDGVGAATFEAGLGLLRPRGTMVLFGQASGPVPPIDPQILNQHGSIFLTRPRLFDHIASRKELERRAADLFGQMADGSLRLRIGGTWDLADAAEAHRALESRATTGKLLLRL